MVCYFCKEDKDCDIRDLITFDKKFETKTVETVPICKACFAKIIYEALKEGQEALP